MYWHVYLCVQHMYIGMPKSLAIREQVSTFYLYRTLLSYKGTLEILTPRRRVLTAMVNVGTPLQIINNTLITIDSTVSLYQCPKNRIFILKLPC